MIYYVQNSSFDYYPFGSTVPGRTYSPKEYRFGFNGQEKENDISGVDGGHLAFKFRIHDSRLGRFSSIDPLSQSYPWNSPYAFAENDVIRNIDLEGGEKLNFNKKREHEEGDTKIETVEKMAINIFINVGNLTPMTYNTVYTLVTEGPSGNIEDFNENMDDLSLLIAKDMIKAKKDEGVQSGFDYMVDRAQKPEVIEDALTAVILWRYFKIGQPKPKFVFEPGPPTIGNAFIRNNIVRLQAKLGKKIGQNRLPFEKSKAGVNKAIKTVQETMDSKSTTSKPFTNSNSELMKDIYSKDTGFTVRVNAKTGEFNTLIEGATEHITKVATK